MSTFEDIASRNRSEKITIVHIEPKQRLSQFTLDSGSTYIRNVDHFIVNVEVDGSSITEESSSTLTAGSFFFDITTNDLYLRMDDDGDPKERFVVVTYRKFLASSPISLPYTLNSGDDEVYYEGRLVSNSPISKSLDDEQIGLVLETNTSLAFENTDGYFDDIYDKLIWENKAVKVWIWFPQTPLSEAFKIFDGLIQDKGFSSESVSFTCKDYNYSLRDNLAVSNFSTSDGEVPERYLNKPKRRIFGLLKQLQCTPIDATLSGYALTGTLSISSGSTALTGSGTSFLDQLSPEDTIIYNDGFRTFNFSIESVTSNTVAVLSSESEKTISGGSFINKPRIPWRKKNRRWHIAGHKLRSPSTTIDSVISASRFTVVDSSDIFAGDIVNVDGENAFVSSVNGFQIRLTANLQAGIPSVSDVVSKNPVFKAYYNGNEIYIDRDWTVTNTTEAILELDNLAEFNSTPEVPISKSLTFTSGSRTVTVSSFDLRTELKPRDWIRSSSVSHTTWYEILDVQETSLTLRVSYAGSTVSGNPRKKNVSYIDDNSVITVDCAGQERSSSWIKTASDAVKDILENDLSFTNINTSSFSQSKEDCPFILSMAIPKRIGGNTMKIRDVLNEINKSVFGSLVIDSDFNFKYSTLNADRPTEIDYITDHDLVSSVVKIESKNEIKKKVNAFYNPFSDKFTGQESFELYQFENEFTTNLVGINDELDITLYLYNQDDAVTIAQRYALYYSLPTSIVSFISNLALAKKQLNDKIMIKFDRLYKRFGATFAGKIGLVNKILIGSTTTSIEVNDLGNTFNRVAAVSDDSTSDFTSASDNEKIVAAWIVDDDTLTPDTSEDDTIYQNLIG